VHGTAAVRCRAQLPQNQDLELQFVLGTCSVGLPRLVGQVPFSDTAMRQGFNCSISGEFESAKAAGSICSPAPLCGRHRMRGTVVHHKLFVATQNLGDGARRGAASRRLGMGIKPLRAGPVSWQPCARGGWLLPSRESCARMVFHTLCDASSHEKRPRVASSS
jgi:hypothetical protein